MKKYLILFLGFTLSNAVYSQTSTFILTGGWAVALPNYSDVSVNGFKIGGQWEKAVIQDHWGYGIEADYFNFKQIGSISAPSTIFKYRSVPVTFYGKYLIGNDKLQAYAKAGAGAQLSTITAENSSIYGRDHDFGIALTAGLGGYYTLTEYLSLNLDYGFLYLTNSQYNSGMINSVSLGIGFKIH